MSFFIVRLINGNECAAAACRPRGKWRNLFIAKLFFPQIYMRILTDIVKNIARISLIFCNSFQVVSIYEIKISIFASAHWCTEIDFALIRRLFVVAENWKFLNKTTMNNLGWSTLYGDDPRFCSFRYSSTSATKSGGAFFLWTYTACCTNSLRSCRRRG